MSEPILEVKQLKTWLKTNNQILRPVDGVDFKIFPGETLALLGESGCGKSMTAFSIVQLLPENAQFSEQSEIYFQQQDLLAQNELSMRNIRGQGISFVFQEPMTSLNPVLTIGEQLFEVLRHQHKKNHLKKRAIELLTDVGIPQPEQRLNDYPHQFSGGMRQRVMIAIALAGEPKLLIADELTTALDVTVQAQILSLLKNLQQKHQMAILLITHDLGVVAQFADQVAVMYAGHIVEQQPKAQFFKQPMHPYSQLLFAAVPKLSDRDQPLAVIPGQLPAIDQAFSRCRFLERCPYKTLQCEQQLPSWSSLENGGVRCLNYQNLQGKISHDVTPEAFHAHTQETVLSVQDLKVHFGITQGIFKRVQGYLHAVDGVDLTIKQGKTLALVGESGSGKTTVGKAILQLINEAQGETVLMQQKLNGLSAKQLRQKRAMMQMVFQDPFSSLDPRMTIREIINEALAIAPPSSQQDTPEQLLEKVGLAATVIDRYPHEFSGGQRQRIAIARALATSPKLIVCDEPTSALDVSVQAQILNLLKKLQQENGLTYLFITHNLAVVSYLADEVAVMYCGRVVEQGETQAVMQHPAHPFTQALINSVPSLIPGQEIVPLAGEAASPSQPPSGCHFHPRCKHAMAVCQTDYPDIRQGPKQQAVKCFLYTQTTSMCRSG